MRVQAQSILVDGAAQNPTWSRRQRRVGSWLLLGSLFGPACSGCFGGPSSTHICDPSQQLDFSEFGDLEGEWKVDKGRSEKVRFKSLSVDASGHLSAIPFGCKEFKHPLVVDDYNVFDFVPGYDARSHLVSANVQKDHARLEYRWEEEGKDNRQGFVELSRIGPDEILVVISLTTWASHAVFKRQ